MINKEDELLVVCMFDETKIAGSVKLEHIKTVIFDYVQVGPMWTALHELLHKRFPQIFCTDIKEEYIKEN